MYNLRTCDNAYTAQNISVIANMIKSNKGRVSITSKESFNTSSVPSIYIPHSLQ